MRLASQRTSWPLFKAPCSTKTTRVSCRLFSTWCEALPTNRGGWTWPDGAIGTAGAGGLAHSALLTGSCGAATWMKKALLTCSAAPIVSSFQVCWSRLGCRLSRPWRADARSLRHTPRPCQRWPVGRPVSSRRAGPKPLPVSCGVFSVTPCYGETSLRGVRHGPCSFPGHARPALCTTY